jgi:hypothetical protein
VPEGDTGRACLVECFDVTGFDLKRFGKCCDRFFVFLYVLQCQPFFKINCWNQREMIFCVTISVDRFIVPVEGNKCPPFFKIRLSLTGLLADCGVK